MYKIFLFGLFIFFGCKLEQKADSIFYNGIIYTANSQKATHEAIAIKDGLILQTGATQEILKWKGSQTKLIDLESQFIMPGLIEGHGHFLHLGESLTTLNLIKTKSWQEILDSVSEKTKTLKPGEFIIGRGWHQEKWIEQPGITVQGYPMHDELSKISPLNPVILSHASGHALIANKLAMELAQISPESQSPKGGRIIKTLKGDPTGVFEENAMELIQNSYKTILEKSSSSEKKRLLIARAYAAGKECIRYGITSFQDAGSTFEEIQFLDSCCNSGFIKTRMYVMLHDNFENQMRDIDKLPYLSQSKYNFSCHAVKAYLDGALGSYGAWLTEAYNDKPDFYGQNTMPIEKLKEIGQKCQDHNLQLCVHGIGDKGNHEILNCFEEIFQSNITDLRWRIEHAQHLNPEDIQRFQNLRVIASMQAIHCTSDAPFVEKRLGYKRAKEGAYVWRSLLDAGARLANGTDCPVESINPFECMYAAITRKRLDNGMAFFPEQKMTRLEALNSYTIWNAYAACEEQFKGSLEPNKLADFIIIDRNLLTCSDVELATSKVKKVYISGIEIPIE